MNDFTYGLKKGLPIGLGYLAVSFAFGVMCSSNGISPIVSTIISFTNLTSAGQFSGIKLILSMASLLEIFVTVFVINSRYALMSLSLSQKVSKDMLPFERLLISFGITDEIYALAIKEEKDVTFRYYLGLMSLPIIGWTLGTLLGALLGNVLPDKVLCAMNIALYAMFIAIVVPDSKSDKGILFVVLLSVSLSCIMNYVPYLSSIGYGFRTVIVTLISCALGAMIFRRGDNYEC